MTSGFERNALTDGLSVGSSTAEIEVGSSRISSTVRAQMFQGFGYESCRFVPLTSFLKMIGHTTVPGLTFSLLSPQTDFDHPMGFF